MAMFGKVLEPVGYMQTVRVLVQGICSYLGGSATAEESAAAQKDLDHIDQELGASGHGLLDDQEVHRLEDDLAVVYYQLGAAVRAQPEFTQREVEVFLQYVQDYRLERQLTALYGRLMGVSALTEQPALLEELVLSRKPKRWEMREFCVKVGGGEEEEEEEEAVSPQGLPTLCKQEATSGWRSVTPEADVSVDEAVETLVNFVLGTGLLCLFTQAALTGRDRALLMKTWSERMAALYRKMKCSGGRCLGYFLEQAEGDVRQQLQEAVQSRSPPEEAAANILQTLEKNYDWLRWAVMLHPAVGPLEDGAEEAEDAKEGADDAVDAPAAATTPLPPHDHLISVASEAPVPHVVACYRDAPAALDKSRIHQLIVDLEWKIPNPPPEVYASIEEDPGRARRYLAARMLRKLQDGLGAGVAVHVVPGRMEMKCNFPPASYYLYEYKHRLASGTVCVFG
ncbi:hypothetical protein EYF80_042653 [Liparis tanakae]|uniref:Uncharacterized protein n=1 Tax=Liparis tanakae TaxID=230148 RepID=A0A4Z2G0V8_9TELE|nr:hypothetical protein EYF80_042653 [Liparis tanakae]